VSVGGGKIWEGRKAGGGGGRRTNVRREWWRGGVRETRGVVRSGENLVEITGGEE